MTPPPATPETPPPFLGTWRRVYLVVIASQVVLALLLALLGELAS